MPVVLEVKIIGLMVTKAVLLHGTLGFYDVSAFEMIRNMLHLCCFSTYYCPYPVNVFPPARGQWSIVLFSSLLTIH